MRRIRPVSPAAFVTKDPGLGVSKTSAQIETRPETFTSPPTKASPSERQLKREVGEKTSETTPSRAGQAEVPPTAGAIPIQRRPGAILIPTTFGATGDPLTPGVTAFPTTFEAAATQSKSGVTEFPTTFGATPPAYGSIPPPAFDTEKEMIDFRDEVLSSEPASPTSPDPSDPIWVLASSRFNLATQSELARNTDETF